MGLIVNPLTARVARTNHRVGLSAVNHAAKRVVKGLTRNRLEARWEGLRFVGTADSWTILNQIRSGKLEAFERDLFVSSLRPGMTVLDIGANIGFYSVIAARRVSPGGSVHSFEPDPRTRRALMTNIDTNHVTNVTVVAAAVSSSSGTATMYMSQTATQSGLHRSMEDSEPESLEVPTVAIDDFGFDEIDVVKMDIEGEEPAALLGMEQTLARSRDPQVFLEFNPTTLAAAERDVSSFAEYLTARFRDVLVIDEKTRTLSPFRATDSGGGRVNLLCRGVVGRHGSRPS